MIALDSIEIIDKDNIQVSWFDNGNHWETWDSGELFSHIVEQYDEIERLNNIIKEFEKELEKERKIDRPRDDYNYGVNNTLDYMWYELQKIKGSDKG